MGCWFSGSGDNRTANRELNNLLNSGVGITILHEPLLYDIGEKYRYVSFQDYKTTREPKSIATQFSIQKSSVKLTRDLSTNFIGFSFYYDTKCEVSISVFFFAQEVIDTQKQQQFLCYDSALSPDPIEAKGSVGENQLLEITPVLNPNNFTEAELGFKNKLLIPISVFLKSDEFSVLTYFKIESNNLVKVREIFIADNTNYEILDAYYTEAEACAVCLTNKKCMLLIPCRHLCLCESCMNYMQTRVLKCPICRSCIKIGYNILSTSERI